MRYTQPQITQSFKASNAVQSVGLPAPNKPTPVIPDTPPETVFCTAGAYETDE